VKEEEASSRVKEEEASSRTREEEASSRVKEEEEAWSRTREVDDVSSRDTSSSTQ
jgi:hypothetical protein